MQATFLRFASVVFKLLLRNIPDASALTSLCIGKLPSPMQHRYLWLTVWHPNVFFRCCTEFSAPAGLGFPQNERAENRKSGSQPIRGYEFGYSIRGCEFSQSLINSKRSPSVRISLQLYFSPPSRLSTSSRFSKRTQPPLWSSTNTSPSRSAVKSGE